MKKGLPPLLFTLAMIVHPIEAHPPGTYYELVKVEYQINSNRTLIAHENYTIYEPSRVTSYTITHTIPTTDVGEVDVWSDIGLPSYQVGQIGEKTVLTITISFTPWSSGRMTYGISYVAGGLVSGSGPTYKSKLGGIRLTQQNFPYQSYVIEVRGPQGSKLFLTDPEAEILAEDPPAVRYRTSVGAPGSFDGLPTTFYSTPAYYKLTLVEGISNPSGEASDIMLDLLLFNHGQSQFAALIDSDPPLKAMYVDEENNWYGNIELRLEPSGSRDVRLELIWACEIHSPEIDNRGALDEIPGELSPYLKEDEWWEKDDDRIKQKAFDIVGDERNAYRVAEQIVKFVCDLVRYETVENRQGALETLRKKYGDCDCFSDLTIALARAAGLPARLSFGWAYQEENFGGHAWVEFYLPREGWQPADPTWAKTSGDYLFKLDPAHVLRGRRGLTSSDSAISRTSYGGDPKIARESSSSVQLETSEAAQAFVQAAEATLGIAERLAAEDEAMNPKLQLAHQKLNDARGALHLEFVGAEEEAIRLARESLQYSNEIIRALGKPLELEPRVHWWFFLVLAGAIVGGGIAVILVARSRGKRSL